MPKVLVANRGEIAIRILRAATELDWSTVSIYTQGDESHTTFSQEAVKLQDATDYLNVERIIQIAVSTECTHVHPGYGFLSENPSLPTALPDTIQFIGTSIETLQIASNKILSRNLAVSLGVQVAPGQNVLTPDDVRAFVHVQGYPVMLKALDGGGGRGIRLVENDISLDEAFKRCLGESPSHQIFVEKALTGPSWKHIEIQVVGDGTSVNHFWERECSIQRRFQKIIEVAPSRLPRDNILPLIESSLKIAKHLKYRGLGTFEFLVDSQKGSWVFLEINPRVQVEHTVTEEVMGIDLVRTQLLLFSPSKSLSSLSMIDVPPIPFGHSVQLRLTAEDSSRSFCLTPGTIKSSDIAWPSGPGVRTDTWLINGPFLDDTKSEWAVGTEFDSLLAKIVIRGSDFEDMTQKAKRAVGELKFRGPVKTNADLLLGVLNHQDWLSGDIDTSWLERNIDAVLASGQSLLDAAKIALPSHYRRIQPEPSVTSRGATLQPGALFHLTLSPLDGSSSPTDATRHVLTLSSIIHNGFPDRLSGTLQTSLSPIPLAFSLLQSSSAAISSSDFELSNPNDPTHVASPFTGKIVDLHPSLLVKNPIDAPQIIKGDTIMVMSVMKMESVITAPATGRIRKLGRGIRVGAVIGESVLVCVLDSDMVAVTSRL